MDITYLGDGIRKRSFERLSDMLDCYFAEKDRLEAERAENQRMMQELLALKAQLDKKDE